MIQDLMEYFNGYPQDIVIKTLFEVNKYFDKDLKKHFKALKDRTGNTLDSFERKMLRNYYYYQNEEILENLHIQRFPHMTYSKSQLNYVIKKTIDRINTLNSDKIINSIKTRIRENNKYSEEKHKCNDWLQKYSKYNDPSLILFNINQTLIDNYGINYESNIYSIINGMYKRLNNYRYVAIIMKDDLYYKGKNITWDLLSNISIYMENFINFNGNFYPFKKDKRIEEMINFLENNDAIINANYKEMASDFYDSISTGFVFSDLLISNNEKIKILIMRKIELDESPISCPSCMEAIGRGNSYPLMFQKSWECINPACPERSKSGRGKRFDEYGTYRYFKLVENNENNKISNEMYRNWHRDIFEPTLDYYSMLILYYSWNNEKVEIINDYYSEDFKARKIECIDYKNIEVEDNIKLKDLKIYKLFDAVSRLYNKIDNKNTVKLDHILIFNDNSTIGIEKNTGINIGCAITSPPYYNAREYSQWPNFILYLIDMMLNAKSIYNNSPKKNFTYLYNVGDIVDRDNIYISSNMSKRRIMLGFYSALIFKIVGFNFVSDIIWDKGEVESKRNSSVNLVSGYLKYVNCYEHVLVFKKEKSEISYSKVCKIKPVYKINCNGENILGHTAPYPEALVQLIEPFIHDNNKYILDPFLGSGTTGLWCKKNNYNFVGYELNKNYYELAKNRISMIDS